MQEIASVAAAAGLNCLPPALFGMHCPLYTSGIQVGPTLTLTLCCIHGPRIQWRYWNVLWSTDRLSVHFNSLFHNSVYLFLFFCMQGVDVRQSSIDSRMHHACRFRAGCMQTCTSFVKRGAENGRPEVGGLKMADQIITFWRYECWQANTLHVYCCCSPDRLAFSSSRLSHNLGVYTLSLHDSSSTADSDDDDDVPQPPFLTDAAATPATEASTSSSPEVIDCFEACLLVRRQCFCLTCADTVTSIDNACPLCRSRIDMVLRV